MSLFDCFNVNFLALHARRSGDVDGEGGISVVQHIWPGLVGPLKALTAHLNILVTSQQVCRNGLMDKLEIRSY